MLVFESLYNRYTNIFVELILCVSDVDYLMDKLRNIIFRIVFILPIPPNLSIVQHRNRASPRGMLLWIYTLKCLGKGGATDSPCAKI